jgi:hypothetical protein
MRLLSIQYVNLLYDYIDTAIPQDEVFQSVWGPVGAKKLTEMCCTQCCGSESEIIRMFWLDPNPKKSSDSDTDSDSDSDTVVG